MLSDLEIAVKAKKEPIAKIAERAKLDKKYLFPYGNFIAKVDLAVLEKLKNSSRGKYILVTSITPTPLGEGKTLTTIGLSMALNRLRRRSFACIRQPSLGPVFGIKGGAAGGGYAQVLPMEDFNLHFTGDVHAVSSAHNLAAAFLDNSVFHGNPLQINPETISCRRVMDISDRFLRSIRIGLGSKKDGTPHDSGFDITAASEVMAILALSENLKDLRQRLSRMVVADDSSGRPVTAEQIKVAGSMAVLLKDAVKPNLIQTIENTPCFAHTGPFANIAPGNSSVIADKIAMGLCDYTVTEAGFGADCGAEKFFDIKCRNSGLIPDAAVMVCSIRALKAHSGKFEVRAGRPLDIGLQQENISLIEEGLGNLAKQIENVKIFGIPVVVAINRFSCDTQKEIDFLKNKALQLGADGCEVNEAWQSGSRGALALAGAVIKLAAGEKKFNYLYPLQMPIKDKIKIIATRIYGASDIAYSELAEQKVRLYTQRRWDNLPVCMAKTQFSLSDDPRLLGRPQGFTITVKDISAFIGAGFLSPICGTIQTMPGLPSHPAGENIDLDEEGNIRGLF